MLKPNPSDLHYTREHEWLKIEGEIATVGITDYAQELLTNIVFVELPEIGKQVLQKKTMAVVESVKSVSDVYAPVSGEVVEINKQLENNPELVNQDAFGQGWLVKIKIKDTGELSSLMTSVQYEEYLTTEKH